jgi:hypothetical protein
MKRLFLIKLCFLTSIMQGSSSSWDAITHQFRTTDTFPNASLKLHFKRSDGTEETRSFLPGDPPVIQTATGCHYLKFADDYRMQGGTIGAVLMFLFMLFVSYLNNANTKTN